MLLKRYHWRWAERPGNWQYLCRPFSMCGGHHHPFGLMREGKVVKLFDAVDWFGEWDEEGLPIISRDKNCAPSSPTNCGTLTS